jgi:hypothetical protein
MEDGGSGVVMQTSDNEAEEDHEDNYDKDNDPAAAFRQAQLERVWKDLQVMFIRTDGRGSNGGDDGASHASNYQPARKFLTAMAVALNSILLERRLLTLVLTNCSVSFLSALIVPK